MTNPQPPSGTTARLSHQLLYGHAATTSPSTTPSSGFIQSTQTPFLRLCGLGRLPKSALSAWLTQDRLYAQSYVRWAGLVLAHTGAQLPRAADRNCLAERVVDCMIGALANVKRELGFFEDVAARYGLRIDVWVEASSEGRSEKSGGDGDDAATGEWAGQLDLRGMSGGARGYARLFERLGTGLETGNASLLDNFVLLWAMEKCYLESWRYAKAIMEQRSSSDDDGGTAVDLDGGALRLELVPNWTGDEFVAFVDAIEGLMQELWERDGGAAGLDGTNTAGKVLLRAERVWREVLAVEEAFWPVVSDA